MKTQVKTFKVYYHTHEIVFEADDIVTYDSDPTLNFFLKNENCIACVPKTCPYTVIAVK